MKKEDRKQYDINIQEAANGFVVTVGCSGPIVFLTKGDLLKELEEFFDGGETELFKEVANQCGIAVPVPDERHTGRPALTRCDK